MFHCVTKKCNKKIQNSKQLWPFKCLISKQGVFWVILNEFDYLIYQKIPIFVG